MSYKQDRRIIEINANVAVGDVNQLLEENDSEGSVAFEYVVPSANKKPAKWRAA
jgi:hypothetical protein